MTYRVHLNFPHHLNEGGVERPVIVQALPNVDDHVMYRGKTYRVSKVLHPVVERGALNLVSEPVVYLTDERDPTVSEARHG